MTHHDRQALIIAYGKAYETLTAALWQYPTEMWQWRPAPGKWSIHEIIVHIADSEANSYIRCRRFIAEPRSGVYGYDENKWASILDYHSQSTDEALDLFKVLRNTTHRLIKTLPDHIWQTAVVQHSESGTVTFDQWLQTYTDHIPVHIRQMDRTYRQWQEQHG